MTPWSSPEVPRLPGPPTVRAPRVLVHDSATDGLVPAALSDEARMYVCGITPYDAAHLGHAHTYVAFDVLHRVLLDSGRTVHYVQNVTDVDDPLLERAAATGDDWRRLARHQTELFAQQMERLSVLPPRTFLAVTEVVDRIGAVVAELVRCGAAYHVPTADTGTGHGDVYFDVGTDPSFGSVSRLDEATMAVLSAQRGGDPARPGKRNPLDPLLWRARRPGEPWWAVPGLPDGRPGWHVECVAIAVDHLGMGFDVQGGGSDLAFPHHEMGASHARVLTGKDTYARAYVHAGMVGLDGEKMSKSRGNLVFVHEVLDGGLDPAALRVALMSHHYRADWSWTDELGRESAARVDRWRTAVGRDTGPPIHRLLADVRAALVNDLDTPKALAAIDAWADAQLATGGDTAGAGTHASHVLATLLGVHLPT
ncbi:MAG: cysteine--1-D-myo-inosityl 2-amino-2-deoxy-alpha-D-glucopyranoside ligase [Kineosporiaceae bacterium]